MSWLSKPAMGGSGGSIGLPSAARSAPRRSPTTLKYSRWESLRTRRLEALAHGPPPPEPSPWPFDPPPPLVVALPRASEALCPQPPLPREARNKHQLTFRHRRLHKRDKLFGFMPVPAGSNCFEGQ